MGTLLTFLLHRTGDGEEYDELESSGIDYFMHRQSNGYSNLSAQNAGGSSAPISARGLGGSSAANRRLVAEHMMELLDNANADAINPSTNPLTAMSPGGSPTRGETFGSVRRGFAQAALGLMFNDENAYSAFLSSKLNAKKAKSENANSNFIAENSGKDLEGFDLAFVESVPWNDEPTYAPFLPGTYTET